MNSGTYRLSPAAERDLASIAEYVATDSADAARKLLAQFTGKFERLARFPEMSRPIPEIAETARLFPVGKHVILYRSVGEDVVIVRVIHTRQDYLRVMKTQPKDQS